MLTFTYAYTLFFFKWSANSCLQVLVHSWRNWLCLSFWWHRSIWRTHVFQMTAQHPSATKTSWTWPTIMDCSPKRSASRKPLETWTLPRQDLMQSCKLLCARWVELNIPWMPENYWQSLQYMFGHAVLYLPCGWLCPQLLSFCSNKIIFLMENVPNLEIQKLDSDFLMYTYILHNYLHILVLTVTWGFWFNFNTM